MFMQGANHAKELGFCYSAWEIESMKSELAS